MYCYDDNGLCPYWDMIDGLPHQESGYCHYLKRGDIDRNNDENYILQQIDLKTGKVIKEIPAPDAEFPIGLLWDQCKECGINEDD